MGSNCVTSHSLAARAFGFLRERHVPEILDFFFHGNALVERAALEVSFHALHLCPMLLPNRQADQ